MKRVIPILLFFGLISAGFSSQMTLVEDVEEGTLTIKDGKVNVLTYRFGDQLKDGVEPNQTRSSYIHPLYSLDGEPLTDDFPTDHPHHHGLFWTWPVIRTRGQDTQTWHPANLRQYFLRWIKREIHDGGVILGVENAWKLDGKEVVAKEILTIKVHPLDESGRLVDLELRFEAVGGPLELCGAPDQNKGYGGLTLRGASRFKNMPIRTERGEFEGEQNNVKLRWADLSTEGAGVSIFASPSHPDFPPSWVLRTSYAGLLNVSWPGLETAILYLAKPITLGYRLYIHRGNMTASQIHRAFQRYVSETRQ